VTLTAPRGVPDYLPPRSLGFAHVRDTLLEVARCGGYEPVELPVFEEVALYERGVGLATDVVAKEMYTFDDRGGRAMALRPEGTAGVIRALIEHGAAAGSLPVKLRYAGPFFRAERPQRGRYRQLAQVGIEAVGSADPALDAEVIALADAGFRRLGVAGYTLGVTSLGCEACRPAYREALTGFLSGCELDEPTRARARLNPLRVLDDKRPEVRRQLADAPLMGEFLCTECRSHHEQVEGFLAESEVAFVPAPRLVRGLDYYTRTTFEFDLPALGAQSGIGGGGRYDGLMAALGGPPLPGIGWGIGIDRTLLALEAQSAAPAPARCAAFVIPIGQSARQRAVRLLANVRRGGVAVDMLFDERGLKAGMRAADRSGAAVAVIIGGEPADAGTAVLRDLASGSQVEVAEADLVDELVRRVGSAHT